MEQTLIIQKDGTTYRLSYTLVRSSRRSIGIEIHAGGTILVRAPYHATKRQIKNVLSQKETWILNHYIQQKNILPQKICEEDSPHIKMLKKRYKDAAIEYIPKRVAHYQTLTGGQYTRITIRDQKTRWGSCSTNGTLSFNFRLMLAPPRVLDYVIVHELCHLTYMNHSKEFWQAVANVIPDYEIYRDWLKQNGASLTIS